ncbi:MAG: hypothetical protein A2840_02960 [Candidatus Buchananbacteria bacterium RIFCSPHIGHO2_01_FULL_47_11b]|uniref:Uncharacterized protein n=1 Tax=Candidatus Buchananbacteria bacterium RIFCSPHIGHO2_01_FULL_47_11b TaxID=1797537 RepID=A0A1G1Y8B2_9BACT|nr:MAG: hypothetical protein A2840_02960 [Candidatus Buchananbacteria bacterium RIFCSPHIGHO2_01_FULL_47_11b]
MLNLQEVFNRLQESKRKQRELKQDYRDTLENSQRYQEIVESIKDLREKKKQIEHETKKDFPQLERLKTDINSDNELLSDLALNSLVKGEVIEISDNNHNQYEPILSVRFKKIL